MFSLSLNPEAENYTLPKNNQIYIVFESAGGEITPAGEWLSFLKTTYCYYLDKKFYSIGDDREVQPELELYFFPGWEVFDNESKTKILNRIKKTRLIDEIISERQSQTNIRNK